MANRDELNCNFLISDTESNNILYGDEIANFEVSAYNGEVAFTLRGDGVQCVVGLDTDDARRLLFLMHKKISEAIELKREFDDLGDSAEVPF